MLHLGALDECLVNASDLYLCIRPVAIHSAEASISSGGGVNLCAVWRKFETNQIAYHCLDPNKDPLTSISLEMLTEELPQLLQTLLVSVEQTINRIPFDELSFPSAAHDDGDEAAGGSSMRKTNTTSSLHTTKPVTASPNGSPKCGLKRREIITKNNKTLHGRYALRRLSLNKCESDSKKEGNASSTTSTIKEPSAMPLFCLGGSFPHIDSDEDSGADDASKSSNERKYPMWCWLVGANQTLSKRMRSNFQLARMYEK